MKGAMPTGLEQRNFGKVYKYMVNFYYGTKFEH